MPQRKNKMRILPHTSIRWKILLALLLIVGLSFGVMASMLTQMVSSYMMDRQTREDTLSVEKLASALAPYLQSASSESMDEELSSAAGELGGRLLVLDTFGKVQYDSFSQMYGMKVRLPEVSEILTGDVSTAYGIHRQGENSEEQVSCCAALMVGTRGKVGVLLYIGTVDEMMESLSNVRGQMLLLFGLVAAAAMAVSMLFSGLLTRPIGALTETIQKMGKGDLSVRAQVKGSGELRELALNYNAMAEQIESLDKSRNQFVSNASHELKTPLATMKVLLESLIYQPEMPQELRTEFMQDMNHEIDRLTGIVTDLLTLTRMDSQKGALKLAPMDVGELAEETVRLLRPQAEKRGQTLTCRAGKGLITLADKDRLAQVFYNLTENALKYTPDGGKISVLCVREGKKLVWSVRDTGVGIPEEDLPHIFERFYRVDKARSRETGGTGLGLSIVRQLVTMHGGEVSVNSTYGEGSEFIVTLPIRKAEE